MLLALTIISTRNANHIEPLTAFLLAHRTVLPGQLFFVETDASGPLLLHSAVTVVTGLERLAAIEADVLRERLAQVIAATGCYTVVHSCSSSVPFGIIRAAGADAVSFDLSQLRRGEEDAVAEAAEVGLGLLTGAVPAVPSPDAGAAFERLAFTHRKEYCRWVADAKREETRDRRVQQALEMLRTGQTLS